MSNHALFQLSSRFVGTCKSRTADAEPVAIITSDGLLFL